MIIENQLSSKPYNSFSADVDLQTVITLNQKEELFLISDILKNDVKVIGGGSNILLTRDINETVLLIDTKGIEVIKESDAYVLVSIAAGEVWHDVVVWAVENNFGGIENLSLIPGKTGAAPIQNIGAYGVEIKDVLHSLKAFHKQEGVEYIFQNKECAFGYRDSHFKGQWKGQFIITEVVLKLTKEGHHKINSSYGAIQSVLERKAIDQPSIKDISDAVIEIRQSKLPDPKVIGNAGSFFKNPIIEKEQFEKILDQHPHMPSYPAGEKVKLAAGWLIDQCGWKGKRVGDTGTHKHQALVIVNHGNATGDDILSVSKQIQLDVKSKFDIDLQPEVNIW